MRFRAIALAVLCAVIGAAVVASGATAKTDGNGNNGNNGNNHKVKKKKAKKEKVSICHRTGNGSFVLIRVGKPAKKAHLRHGDVLPNAQGACPAPPPVEPTRFSSGPTLDFGPNGWAGWSCPTGMKAVGGGSDLADFTAQGIAEPGATIGGSTYPVFPHYTFAAGETGFVVQNDNDTEVDRTVFVDCVPV